VSISRTRISASPKKTPKKVESPVRPLKRVVSDDEPKVALDSGDSMEIVLAKNPHALAVAVVDDVPQLVTKLGPPPEWARQSRVYPRDIMAGRDLIGCGWPESAFEDAIDLTV